MGRLGREVTPQQVIWPGALQMADAGRGAVVGAMLTRRATLLLPALFACPAAGAPRARLAGPAHYPAARLRRRWRGGYHLPPAGAAAGGGAGQASGGAGAAGSGRQDRQRNWPARRRMGSTRSCPPAATARRPPSAAPAARPGGWLRLDQHFPALCLRAGGAGGRALRRPCGADRGGAAGAGGRCNTANRPAPHHLTGEAC